MLRASMFGDFGNKIARLRNGVNTYSIGLLQAKAFRILKKHTREYLEPHDLATIDWALLGALYRQDDGHTFGELSSIMGVRAPYITRMIKKLSAQSLVQVLHIKEDRRTKVVRLTKGGRDLVEAVEKGLRSHMRSVMKGVSARDVLGYIAVLRHIVDNAPDDVVDDPYTF